MTTEHTESTNCDGESAAGDSGEMRAALLRGPDGACYLIPTMVFEAFRLGGAELTSLEAEGDVGGHFYSLQPWQLSVIRISNTVTDTAASVWAGVTSLVSGSGSKFEVTTDRAIAGVRG